MKARYIIAALGAALLLAPGCEDDSEIVPVNTPAINITTQKLAPDTNESGTVRAYIGTEVTAQGFNLDKVSRVTLDEVEAAITKQDIKTLAFEVPQMDLAQSDDPHKVLLQVYDADGETVIFKYDYFITVPVTDALVSGYAPKSGTVGTGVTISGRNLEQVTKVTVGGVDAAIVEKTADAIVIAIPAISVTAAVSEQAIAATWPLGTIDVTAAEKFSFNIPVFDAVTQTDNARAGDEIALTGANLDLVAKVLWGDVELLVVEQSAAAMTVKIPSGIELADPAVQTKALTGVYGTPGQSVTIASSYAVDTTPVGPAAPVYASIAPTDTQYDKIFLGREVTVKGENFASIEKFEIDGIEVELSEAATDIAAKFVVPKTITGTAKKSVTLTAVWNGGNKADFGTVELYPFYFTKGLKLASGSNSKNTYPAWNSENAFLLFNEGKVISVSSFKDDAVDAPALTGSANAVTSGNKVIGTKEAYYGVEPYMFLTSSSAHKMAFQNPANSASQLKCHFISGTALSSTYGTPVIFMKILGSGDLKTALSEGTLEDIVSGYEAAGTSAPAFGTSEGSTWIKGSVIGVQYVNYAHASTTGGKPSSIDDVKQLGYMVIRDVTCGDPATGLALTTREGYVEIDLYWSNVINE